MDVEDTITLWVHMDWATLDRNTETNFSKNINNLVLKLLVRYERPCRTFAMKMPDYILINFCHLKDLTLWLVSIRPKGALKRA